MTRRSISGWLVGVVFLGVLLGVVGGGLMGGVVGYYVAANRAPGIMPSALGQLVAARPSGLPPVVTSNSVSQDAAVIDTVKKSAPAVVTVVNTLQRTTGRGGPGANVAEGSGVIIDDQGHVVTNAHVVDGATQIDVILADGTKASARVLGADNVSDIAVLQMSGQIPASLSWGDSSTLELGETVIAIGSPLGNYRGSVTVGVVSGMNRSVQGTGQDGLIQTDAAINHGNSGGPLLNLAGQIIGINTLVVRNTNSGDLAEGLGFAVPSNTVSAVVKQLLAGGQVKYPFIGITYEEITPASAVSQNLAAPQGVLVQQVTPGTPAANAGIQVNDIVTAIDGTKIDEAHPLRSILFQHQPGDTVTLTVLRGGRTLAIKITLTERPAQSG